jgi:hypothetical protein
MPLRTSCLTLRVGRAMIAETFFSAETFYLYSVKIFRAKKTFRAKAPARAAGNRANWTNGTAKTGRGRLKGHGSRRELYR